MLMLLVHRSTLSNKVLEYMYVKIPNLVILKLDGEGGMKYTGISKDRSLIRCVPSWRQIGGCFLCVSLLLLVAN